jgi:hypothetical protein
MTNAHFGRNFAEADVEQDAGMKMLHLSLEFFRRLHCLRFGGTGQQYGKLGAPHASNTTSHGSDYFQLPQADPTIVGDDDMIVQTYVQFLAQSFE